MAKKKNLTDEEKEFEKLYLKIKIIIIVCIVFRLSILLINNNKISDTYTYKYDYDNFNEYIEYELESAKWNAYDIKLVLNRDNTCIYPDNSYGSCTWKKEGNEIKFQAKRYVLYNVALEEDSEDYLLNVDYFDTLEECEKGTHYSQSFEDYFKCKVEVINETGIIHTSWFLVPSKYIELKGTYFTK